MTGIAISWNMCNCSFKNVMEKITPNIDDEAKIIIVLTLPILFRLCKKKKIDMPKPPAPRRIMFGTSVKLIFI